MPPQNTWFFTDSSGRIFPTNEKEAFNLLTEKSKWRRQDIKMIGMSDGKTYYDVIKNAGAEKTALKEKIQQLKEKRNKYIEGHDKLMFEEFVPETDPRIVRAKAVIKQVDDEIAPAEKELKTLMDGLIQKAFDSEVEKARGNMVNPRDFTVIGKGDGSIKSNATLQSIANARRVI